MNKRPPMPPRGGFDGKPMKRKINFKTLGRTVKLLFKFYPVLVPVTIGCILFSALCSVLPAIFIQEIIQILMNLVKHRRFQMLWGYTFPDRAFWNCPHTSGPHCR